MEREIDLEDLAVASLAVGRIIAYQDKRTMTPQMAMDIVLKNINIGNQEMIANDK